MAGCKPEYMPVLLAALDAALEPKFTLHGLTCSTCFSSPIIVVNGPVAKAIGMNWGVNVLGQGNRANATIGRALNLVVRNVGGGIPGGIDRATIGGPHKIGLCFAEDETDPAWVPLFVHARGLVMETGGVLSHGAIVAREFGLPAVAGLPGVVRQLHSGQRLRVDGSLGTVTIL